jgi:hypothetical protein
MGSADRRRDRLALGALLALAAALSAPRPALASVFSPGPLARGHEHLEGLSSCTQCHAAGEKLSQERCLACHVELKDRVARGQGFHGRIPAAERACESCHHEHQGRDFALLDWGAGGRDRFDHARTGVPLKGKHLGAACQKCHDPRLVVDPVVRARLEKHPGRPTYLGTATACGGCHFDDHRGQVSTECGRCHGEQAWKPASRGFSHARVRYRLEGKHARVECVKCHPRRTDETTAPGTFPAPVSTSFLALRPLPFDDCTDCHKKDPHAGKFGGSCQACHTLQGWKALSAKGKERAFHAKTRYPLEGAHVEVGCRPCHGPFRGEKARYKGLPFKACTDCHVDAHVGQLARPGRPAPGCDACHALSGWKPVRYEVEDHAKAAYPLGGAHRPVACVGCHPPDERLRQRVPPAVRAGLARQERPLRVSPAALSRPGFRRCETCHRDPHAGQFAARKAEPSSCLVCHQVGGWRELLFDHARDSRFPLAGKHARAACAACHPAREDGRVVYRPIDVACASCHVDVHAGQFPRPGGGPGDCGRCHDAASWKAERFAHAPPFTAYRLVGKHAPLKCDTCHPAVAVAPGVTSKRYRPLPTACEGCHADFHKGAFRGFVP